MFQRLNSYLSFLWNSKNQYGVHSPFVYEYLTLGLQKKPERNDWLKWKSFQKKLCSDDSTIQVTDFGAGSKIFKSPERKVSQIAKTAGISSRRAKRLYQTVKHFNPDSILEIGTSLGLATSIMGIAASKADIHSLEGCPETAEVAKNTFEFARIDNIRLHVGEFEKTLPDLIQNHQFDLIFFDGNHQKEATLRYFELCLRAAHENSVFILDDIHWSIEMEEAWREIIKNERVSLSIDSYRWGLIFFQKGREKEHFVLRL